MAQRTRSSYGRAAGAGRGAGTSARWSGDRVTVQTPFSLAEVLPEPGRPWRRLLRLDGDDCSHVDLRDPTAIDFAYVRRLADIVDVIAPAGGPLDIVHLGGGGFTLPRYVAATRPRSRQEVAEIDGELIALARRELGLAPTRGLRIRVADARAVLERRRPGSADLVVLDAFLGETIPPHLATAECVAAAARALRDGGVFAANVIDAPPMAVARPLMAAIDATFPHTALVAARKVVRGRQGGNLVLVGAKRPLALTDLGRRALAGPAPELVVGGEQLAAWIGGAEPTHDPS